jgi:hypothetical protein
MPFHSKYVIFRAAACQPIGHNIWTYHAKISLSERYSKAKSEIKTKGGALFANTEFFIAFYYNHLYLWRDRLLNLSYTKV